MAKKKLTEEEKRQKHLQNSRDYYTKNRDKVNAKKKLYREANKEKLAESRKVYYENNKEKVLLGCKESKKKNAERVKNYDKMYKEANRDRINERRRGEKARNTSKEYEKKKRQSSINYKLTCTGRGRRRAVLKLQSAKKLMSYEESLGCTVEFFKKHIESLWLPGMSWDNYGKKGWHIDEIRPCASFDLTDPEQYRQCFHYTNCQPLWYEDNIRKSSWWNGKKYKHKK